ncbi:MAG: MAPEG family protein [Pseudomonadota bacterium]
MGFPIISASLGAFLIIIQQILLMNVGMHRTKHAVGVGTGSDAHLERKIRRHGNLAENAAIFLILLALMEMYGTSAALVAGFAIAFATARILHVFAFMRLSGSHEPSGFFSLLRALGAFGTVLCGLGVGGSLLYFMYG